MNISRKRRMMIVLAIGIIFILFGIAQALFQFELDKKIVDQVSLVLMIIAVALIFSGRKRNNQSEEESQAGDENTDSNSQMSEAVPSEGSDAKDIVDDCNNNKD